MEVMLGGKACVKQFEGDYGQSVDELLDKFPSFLKKIKNKSVLIKPNFWTPLPCGSGSVTDAYLVREIARCLLDNGAKKVTVGEGTAVGYAFRFKHTADEVFETTGIVSALKDMPVSIVDLNKGPFAEIQRDNFLVFDSIQVAESVLEHEIIVNVPVMKTHFRTRYSLGMKNLKGVLSPRDKRNCHKLGLDEGIVDLNSVVHPDFVIVDGIAGIEGLWEYPNDTVKPNLLVGAPNPLHADMVAATIMGIEPTRARHLSLALEKNLFPDESIALDQIPSTFIKPFKDPGEVLRERFPRTSLYINDACTGCYGAITAPLIKLYNEGRANLLDDYVIVSGPGCEKIPVQNLAGGNTILVGQCAKSIAGKDDLYVGGCPPSQDEVMNTLTFYEDKKRSD